jgi:hypothetical protein
MTHLGYCGAVTDPVALVTFFFAGFRLDDFF